MLELLNPILQLNAWPLWLLIVGIPAFGLWLQHYFNAKQAAIKREGVAKQGKVIEARIYRGFYLVRYKFEANNGQTYVRSGRLSLPVQEPIVVGSKIGVKYLGNNPKWSRMLQEIQT